MTAVLTAAERTLGDVARIAFTDASNPEEALVRIRACLQEPVAQALMTQTRTVDMQAMRDFCVRTASEARALGYRGAIVAVSVEANDHTYYWVEASGACFELQGLGLEVWRYVRRLWMGKRSTVVHRSAFTTTMTGDGIPGGGGGGA